MKYFSAAVVGKPNSSIISVALLHITISHVLPRGENPKIRVMGCLNVLFFAFSTVLSWNLFGKLNVQYLSGNKKSAALLYTAVSIAFIFLGTLLSNNLVWELTDFFNYLMVLPNVVSLIALGSLVTKSAADGEAAWKAKKADKKSRK